MAVKTITVPISDGTDLLQTLIAKNIIPTATDKSDGVNFKATVDITPEQEAELVASSGGTSIKEGILKATAVITDFADSAVNKVVIPVGSAGIGVAAAVGRITVKATAQAGASAINSVVDEGVRAIHDIKDNDEYKKLKVSYKTVKDGISGLFSSTPKMKIS